eukprot:scpid54914/ scgid13688/ Tubby protein homolog
MEGATAAPSNMITESKRPPSTATSVQRKEETAELKLTPLSNGMTQAERMQARDTRVEQYAEFKKDQKKASIGGKYRPGAAASLKPRPKFELLPPTWVDTGDRPKIYVGARANESKPKPDKGAASSTKESTNATSNRPARGNGVKHGQQGIGDIARFPSMESLECETTIAVRPDSGIYHAQATAQDDITDQSQRDYADAAAASSAATDSAAVMPEATGGEVAGAAAVARHAPARRSTTGGSTAWAPSDDEDEADDGADNSSDSDEQEEVGDLVKFPVGGPSLGAQHLYGPRVTEELSLEAVLSRPIPHDCYARCHFWVKKGIHTMVMELTDHSRQFLLAAKKRSMATGTEFLISKTEGQEITKHSGSYLGKLRCNLTGTEFTLYDDGTNPHKLGRAFPDYSNLREEILGIHVGRAMLGLSGPRHLSIIIPHLNQNDERLKVLPKKGK